MTLAADDSESNTRLAAFLKSVRQLGWIDGDNVRIDVRWGAGDSGSSRRLGAELITLAPDVILANGSAAVSSLLQSTRTLPVVFTSLIDPVGGGFVDSLARPGGNVTGFTLSEHGTSAKWLELLKEISPGVTRAAVLLDLTISSGSAQLDAIQSAAGSFGVELRPVPAYPAAGRSFGEHRPAVHNAARKTHQRLQELSFVTPKRPLQQNLPGTDMFRHSIDYDIWRISETNDVAI